MATLVLRAALVAALFFCGAASAQTLLSGFVSKHASGDYRESNPGIGLRIDSGPWSGWAIGTYRNSLNRQTVYVGKEWLWQIAGPIHVGALAVLATGYQIVIVPAVLPEVVMRFKRMEAAIVIQPLRLQQSPAFVALQLRYRF